MNIKEITALQKAIRSGQSVFKSQALVWREIHEKFGVGKVVGKQVQFSKSDIHRLREIYEKNHDNINVLSIDTAGNRDDFAKRGLDEKISNRPVFENLVWLASPKDIVLTKGLAKTPENSLVAARQEEVELKNVSHLVLVENGSSAVNWSDIHLPENYQRPLFVYRGHTRSLNYVKALFNRAVCKKVASVDIDPLGLLICNVEIPCDSMLLPINWRNLLVAKDMQQADNSASLREGNSLLSKRDTFLGQELYLQGRKQPLTENAKILLDFILDHKIAVMQEHLTASGLGLEEYMF